MKYKIGNLKCAPQGFTIVELLVAMSLLVMLLGLSGMVFNTTVAAHRAAGATIDVSRKLRAITDQLNRDFRGLRKDGEIFLVWLARPAIDEKGVEIVPLQYQKFDRIVFFADGDFQTIRQQAMTAVAGGGSKIVSGNLARISYAPAKNTVGDKSSMQPDRARRILSRTQHIVTADSALPDFPDWSIAWDPVAFDMDNFFKYEYQTTTMGTWTNMSQLPSADPGFIAKNDILTIMSDVSNILVASSISEGGPKVEIGDSSTYHNLFSTGFSDFGIQIWLEDKQRWYPQIDPDGDGDYSDTDYPLDGSVIHQTLVGGVLYPGTGESELKTNNNMSVPSPLKFTALKFTFTLFDSNKIFPDGKTFTHIVYLDN